jgi:hypothetical protein
MDKTRKLVSFEKLDATLRKQLLREYPDGFGNAVMKIEAPTPFYAVRFESEDTSYLIKLSNYVVESLEDDEDEDDERDEMDTDDLELDEDED